MLLDEAAHIDPDLFAVTWPMVTVTKGRIVLLSTPHSRQGTFADIFLGDDPEWDRHLITAQDSPPGGSDDASKGLPIAIPAS